MGYPRCQNWDDKGEQVPGRKCLNDCKFVHPWDGRRWTNAVRTRPVAAPLQSFKGRRTSTHSEPSFIGTSYGTAERSGSGGWGSRNGNDWVKSSTSLADTSKNDSTSSGWGGVGGGGGWGDLSTAKSSGDHADASGGWGGVTASATLSSGDNSNNNNGGWGTGDSGWADSWKSVPSASGGGGWGDSGGGGSWGDSGSGGGWDDSGGGTSSTNAGGGWGEGWGNSGSNAQSSTAQDAVQSSGSKGGSTRPTEWETTNETVIAPDASMDTMSTQVVDEPDNIPDPVALHDNYTLYTPRPKSQSPWLSRDVSIAPSESRSSLQASNMSPIEQFIELLRRGISAQADLKEADTNVERWRRTQLSVIYKRCGQAARIRLDAVRMEYQKARQQQYDRLAKAAEQLAELDITTVVRNAVESVGGFQDYTGNVRQWLGGIMLQVKQIADALKPAEEEPKTKGGDAETESESPLDALINQCDELEQRISDRGSDFMDSAQERMSGYINRLLSTSASQSAAGLDVQSALIAEDLSIRAAQLGADVEEEANQIAALITEHRGLAAEQQVLVADSAQLEAGFASLEEQQTRRDTVLQEHEAELEKIRTFVSNFNSSPPIPSVSIDNLIQAVKANVDVLVGEKIRQMSDSLSAGAEASLRQQQEELIPHVWNSVQPALQLVQTLQSFRGNGDTYIGQL